MSGLGTVHVVLAPTSPEGQGIADQLVLALFEDPDDLTQHGLRIPVRVWPDPYRLSEIGALDARSVVIPLVDSAFILGSGWPEWLADLAATGSAGLLVPVALNRAFFDLPSSHLDAVRAPDGDVAFRREYVVNRLLHQIYQQARGEDRPLRVFVSHAKLDGETAADEVRDYLHDGSGIEDWFDAQNLKPGSDWAPAIRRAAGDALVLALRSDAYATREWCRIEVLEAKRAGAPVVVLDLLGTGESRSFPYLGNVPVVRWDANPTPLAWERLLTVILLEALRYAHFPERVRRICDAHRLTAPDLVLPRPPELLTMLATDAATSGVRTVVYPDPPLGVEERDLIERAAPGVVLLTPTRLLAGDHDGR